MASKTKFVFVSKLPQRSKRTGRFIKGKAKAVKRKTAKRKTTKRRRR